MSKVELGGKRSASGVRRGGDHFQDLFVWAAALELLRPATRYMQLGMEIDGVGNLDDVVLRTPGEPGGIYGQVKWATKPAADPVSEDFLFAVKGSGRSILQKLHASWLKLGDADVCPQLRFITNRGLAADDALLGHVDGGTDRLNPFARGATPNSDAGHALARWASHVGVSTAEMLDMFDHLYFHVGRTKTAEELRIRDLMLAVGLDDSARALSKGTGAVADWIVSGIRTRNADDVLQMVEHLDLQRKSPSVILSIQAIDYDPHVIDADHCVDWVHLHDGDTPRTRTVARDSAAWEVMTDDMDRIAAEIEDRGIRSVMVRGAMRQATFFKVGTALPQTRNFQLVYQQGQQVWATSDAKRPIEVTSRSISVGDGEDLAVAVGITLDPTDEVMRYLTDHSIPAGSLLTIAPAAGSHDQAVTAGGHAVALAERIRNEARQASGGRPPLSRIHLFLAGPGGLALLLGHRWNRLRQTTVYEHRGIGLGYQPAFVVDT